MDVTDGVGETWKAVWLKNLKPLGLQLKWRKERQRRYAMFPSDAIVGVDGEWVDWEIEEGELGFKEFSWDGGMFGVEQEIWKGNLEKHLFNTANELNWWVLIWEELEKET